MSKAEQIRELLAQGERPARVAERVGVARAYVYQARKATSTRGRPRLRIPESEAIARWLEEEAELYTDLKLAARIRAGEWRKFL